MTLLLRSDRHRLALPALSAEHLALDEDTRGGCGRVDSVFQRSAERAGVSGASFEPRFEVPDPAFELFDLLPQEAYRGL